MRYISLMIVAAFLIYMIAVILGIGKDVIGTLATITIVIVIAVAIAARKRIKYARRQKAINGFYETQIRDSPAAKAFYDEALTIIKDKYPTPEQQNIENCAALLGLPMIDEKSVFYDYYRPLYDDIEGLTILYAQKKSWLTGEIHNYCDREIVKKYDNLSASDEAMLTRFPWLISLDLLNAF